MKINSQQKPLKFNIDCWATCNVITFDLVPANFKIQKRQLSLKVYNGQRMKTIDSCDLFLTNLRNGKTYENFVEVNRGLHPIKHNSADELDFCSA